MQEVLYLSCKEQQPALTKASPDVVQFTGVAAKLQFSLQIVLLCFLLQDLSHVFPRLAAIFSNRGEVMCVNYVYFILKRKLH